MAMAQSAPEPAELAPELGAQMGAQVVEAPPEELNQWKRGFTPQAEIWNGRMAMLGLSVGIGVLVVARLLG